MTECFLNVPPKISKKIDERLDYLRKKSTDIGYRFVGRHSAIKVCNWTKQCIRGKDVCYKNKFYGINSHQCVQMSPAIFFCTFNCRHCWRNFDFILPRKNEKWDNPNDIIDKCIEEQVKYLQGFGGSSTVDKKIFKEAMKPKHFAISLAGEPTLYPKLPKFIDNILDRKMTAFLVTNGTNPEMIKKLIDHPPTNLYISLYGTNNEMHKKTSRPMITNSWAKIMKSIKLLDKFDNDTVIRLTLSKGLNFEDPEGYAKIIENSGAKYVECKAFMAVGGSRRFMSYSQMPLHEEIKEFAAKLENLTSYKIVNEKKESRVVLLRR
jgi:tRNA wybutosine-synthesizing protein 1